MKNNKGFSLIEILGVIVILGILLTLSLTAYTRYQRKATQKAYDILRESASYAAENYFMDHRFETEVEIQKLVDEDYLENNIDPFDDTKRCGGEVKKFSNTAESGDALSVETYKVALRCEKHESCQIYPSSLECSADDGIITDGTNYYDMGLAEYNFGSSMAFAIRLKFNELPSGVAKGYFGNWSHAGGGLALTEEDKFYISLYSTSDNQYHTLTSDKLAYTNHWYVVVGTVKSGQLKLYVDGEQLKQSNGTDYESFPGSIKISPCNVLVGADPTETGGIEYPAKITVSDAIIFGEGLDDSEITNYFSTPNMPFNYNGTKRVLNKKSF